MMLFQTILLSGCQSDVKPFIPSCNIPTELEKGASWRDLLAKYIETRQNLILCAEKVDNYNKQVMK